MPAFGDTVQPDGMLKDASEMDWTFNADESIPFPSTKASSGHTSSSGSPAHAEKVVGVCWTTWVSCPSWHVHEEVESATSTAATGICPPKCSAPHDSSGHWVMKKPAINVDDSDSASNGSTTTEPATEPALDDYEVLKAMPDANNQAVTLKTKADCTADIHLMFHCEKGYIHPDTGEVLDGRWCTTCCNDPTLKQMVCFLTRSNSSLHMHIARNHIELYQKCCSAVGIKPHT
ncbi:hypothetical protein EI94DRAFT_1695843 [Lactarius quietus]|nr:hypothetical protein EI94DRAFT_1695843 [Lactarius quietus]